MTAVCTSGKISPYHENRSTVPLVRVLGTCMCGPGTIFPNVEIVLGY